MKVYEYKLSYVGKKFSSKLIKISKVGKLKFYYGGIVLIKKPHESMSNSWFDMKGKVLPQRYLTDKFLFFSLIEFSNKEIAKYVLSNFDVKNEKKKNYLMKEIIK